MDFKEYEFSNSQTELIHDLSNDIHLVSIFLKVFGWLTVLGGLLQGWLDRDYFSCFSYILMGVLTLLIAFWSAKAADSFKLILNNKGNDIKNLMVGLGKVNKIYRLQFWIWILAPFYLIGSILFLWFS